MPNWLPIKNMPHLQWAKTHEQGTVMLRDLRDPESEVLVSGQEEYDLWVGEHSQSDAYLPVGDWVGRATRALGIKQCGPCAKRRALLNRLFPAIRR